MEWNSLSWEALILLSIFAAPLGCLLIFRRMSYFGDALGHSALAGVVVIYLMGWQSPWALSAGAIASVLLTSQILKFLESQFRLPTDLALTVSSAGMLGLGILLSASAPIQLEHLLVGDLAAINESMVWFLRLLAVVMLSFLIFMWKPLWASVIDARFARSLGFSSHRFDFLLLALTSVTVVGLIQSVGAILVATYLVFPAAASLAWAKSLRSLVVSSIVFALASSFFGAYASMRLQFAPAPAIATFGFLATLLSHGVARLIPSKD